MADDDTDKPKKKGKTPTAVAWDDPSAFEPVLPWAAGDVFLDWLSGIGGMPRGRVVETYGPESSGKSTLALQVSSHVARTEAVPSWYWDAEDALDTRYAQALGHSSATLRLFDRNEVETLEDFLETLKAMLQPAAFAKAPFALVIVDSVAAARCRKQMGGGVDERTLGIEKARIWSDNLPVLVKLLADTGATLVLVNQVRDNVDLSGDFVPPGIARMRPKTRTPGGRAIKFYASLRIEYEPVSEVKEPRWNPLTLETEQAVVGKNVWMRVTKNKVSPPPWRKMRVQIRDGLGFDYAQNLLDFCQLHGLLHRDKGVWTFPAWLWTTGEDFIVRAAEGHSGDAVAVHLLRSRPDIAANLAARVVDILNSSTDYRDDRPPVFDPDDALEAPAP